MPERIALATRCARLTLLVHSPAPRPYLVSLARQIASLSSVNVVTVTNGPNTSSRHTVWCGAHDGRLDEAAARQRRIGGHRAAGQELAALAARDVAVLEHALLMDAAGQRAHLGRAVERVAEADALREREELLEERAGDRLVEQDARAGDAGLALVVEHGERAAGDRCGQLGVVEHDVGALAAELELQLLEVAGRGLDDL